MARGIRRSTDREEDAAIVTDAHAAAAGDRAPQLDSALAAVFRQSTIGMAIAMPEGRLVDVNPTLCRMLGNAREELLALGIEAILPPVDPACDGMRQTGRAAEGAGAVEREVRYQRRDGSVLWGLVTISPLDDVDRALGELIQVQDISPRKHAESLLRDSDVRFRRMFEGAGIGISLTDPNGPILDANPALCRLLGYSRDEMIAMTFLDITHPDDIAVSLEMARKLAIGECDADTLEKRYLRKDGRVVWSHLTSNVLRDADGHPRYIIAQIQDITARREAEAALMESEARFRALVHNDPDVIAVVDAAMHVVYMSPSSMSAFGLAPDAMLGPAEPRFQFIHPADRSAAIALFDQIQGRHGAAASIEARLWHEERGWRWFQATVSNQLADPSIAGYVFNLRDITARREAEAARDVSQTRLRSIFEGAGVGMAFTVPGRGIVVANPAMARFLGYTPEELVGVEIEAITHPDDLLRQVAHRQRLHAGDTDAYRMEKRYRRKDGTIVWGLLDVTALRDERGAIEGVIGQVQDITARKEAEAALIESEARFRALVQYNPDVIVVVDRAMRATYVSPSAMVAFGAPPDHLLGPIDPTMAFVHADDRSQVLALFESVRDQEGQTASVEARFRHRALGWRWLQVTIANQLQTAGIDGYLCNLRDITERKQAELATLAAMRAQEQAIAELERLNHAKSRFLSTISHEFRTPLTAIIGYSELLAADESDPKLLAEDAAVIHREASRLNRMVDDVLLVDRLERGHLSLNAERIDLNAIVRQVVATLRPIGEGHRVTLALEPRLRRIEGDSDRLAQAVTNLVSNAVKYTPAEGAITIVTANEGEHIVLSVRDEGIGIATEDVVRIFERFERVETGIASRIGGTGLGLPIAREIAQLHRGELSVTSELGQGSTFRLALPVQRPRRRRLSVGSRESEVGR
jgi:PAS domain S-box-containing protein